MKILIAVVSCKAHAGYRAAIRETWLPKVPKDKADVFFFMGRGAEVTESDEIVLDGCGDDYGSLPSKIQEIIRWALERGYTNLVKIDNDVVLNVDRFLRSDFEQWDFNGHTNKDGGSLLVPWGFCYTLSKRAMEHIAKAPLPGNNNDECWVANTLAQQGITLHHEPAYLLHRGKRSDFIIPTKRPLRAPPRPTPMDEVTSGNGIAYCVFLHWFGYHSTPDETNIKEYHKLFKETQ